MMYAVIGLIALCAGILQGVTGFGAGIVMMMVLPGFFPLNQAAGVSCAIAIILSLFMFLRYRKYIRIKNVIWPAVLYVAVSSVSIVFSTILSVPHILFFITLHNRKKESFQPDPVCGFLNNSHYTDSAGICKDGLGYKFQVRSPTSPGFPAT